jgi:hypothetical protein
VWGLELVEGVLSLIIFDTHEACLIIGLINPKRPLTDGLSLESFRIPSHSA